MTDNGKMIAFIFCSTHDVPWLRWLFSATIIAHPRVRSRASPCEMCHGNGTGFLRVLRFSCHQSHSIDAPHTTTLMPLRKASRHNLVALIHSSSPYQEALDTQVCSHIFYQASLSQIHLLFRLIYATESRDRSAFSYPGAIFKLPSTRQTAKGPVSLEVQQLTV